MTGIPTIHSAREIAGFVSERFSDEILAC